MTQLIPGEIYEVRPLIRVDFGNGNRTPEAWFMRLVGFSSKGEPIFQNGDKYQAFDENYNKILPLSKVELCSHIKCVGTGCRVCG